MCRIFVVSCLDQPYQVGILSLGSGFCGGFLGQTAPDVYMRTSHFVAWIANVTSGGA